jgi:hypothetical protein
LGQREAEKVRRRERIVAKTERKKKREWRKEKSKDGLKK